MPNTTLENTKVVFFGTPDFAAYQLEYLKNNGVNVVAVVTAPDKPKGRGKKLQSPPVKESAEKLQIPILQPTNLKSEEFNTELKSFGAHLQIVVAFRMLPKMVWDMPPMGTMNLHASYLPNYRGAAPINHCIINGETETGVSTFLLKHEIDTGDVLLRKKVQIEPTWNAGNLHDELMQQGAPLILESVKGLINDTITPISQNELKDTPSNEAPKIFKPDMVIDWKRPAKEIIHFILGLSPFPGAFQYFVDENETDVIVKVFNAVKTESSTKLSPGEWFIQGKDTLLIGTADTAIEVLELQIQGKKRMKAADLLRGFNILTLKPKKL